MKSWIVLIILLFLVTSLQADNGNYASYFADQTMRVDYYHTGTATVEYFSLDQAYLSTPWAGSKINLVDTLNLGKYLLKVFDVATNQLIYSRGFASIFGEWQTTDEARQGVLRSFHETMLFPMPKRLVQVVIATRDQRMIFHDQFSTVIDPNSRFVSREVRTPKLPVFDLFVNGPTDKKVDILILGDGYTAQEMAKFHQDVEHHIGVLFQTAPFKERKQDFNVRAIEVISQESGIDEPEKKIWKNTALGCSFNSLDSPRYVLTSENKVLRDIASAAPYDFLFVLFNNNRYGGGGIFQLYATCFSGTDVAGEDWQADYVFVHEFGHSFAGLGDEYYSSSVSYIDFYPPGVEPWEPNVTALVDKDNLKWRKLLEPQPPLPTPWDKTAYDSLETIRGKLDRSDMAKYYRDRDAIFAQEKELLKRQQYWQRVGAYEGAGYSSKDLYRPYLDCRMFSLSLVDFDPVCKAAIERMINFYSR